MLSWKGRCESTELAYFAIKANRYRYPSPVENGISTMERFRRGCLCAHLFTLLITIPNSNRRRMAAYNAVMSRPCDELVHPPRRPISELMPLMFFPGLKPEVASRLTNAWKLSHPEQYNELVVMVNEYETYNNT